MNLIDRLAFASRSFAYYRKLHQGGASLNCIKIIVVIEAMEQLFCFQYNQLKKDKKVKYIRRILELNKGN